MVDKCTTSTYAYNVIRWQVIIIIYTVAQYTANCNNAMKFDNEQVLTLVFLGLSY